MTELLQILADDLDHPEGVAWRPSGDLIAGGEQGQVYCVSLTGGVEVLGCTGGFALGVAADGDGNVYVCDAGRRAVLRIDSAGAATTFCDKASGRRLTQPNMAAFDSRGNLYVTDSGVWGRDDGCIVKVSPHGEAAVWSEQSRLFPNGCCVSADEDWLYVVESRLPGLVRLRIGIDGRSGGREVVTTLPGTVPDGVALDIGGRAYVACYRPDMVLRVDLDGTVESLLHDPSGQLLNQPTNAAFAGADLDQFIVANLGGRHLTRCVLAATGLPLRYPPAPSPCAAPLAR